VRAEQLGQGGVGWRFEFGGHRAGVHRRNGGQVRCAEVLGDERSCGVGVQQSRQRLAAVDRIAGSMRVQVRNQVGQHDPSLETHLLR
jgi:hypothetical protein